MIFPQKEFQFEIKTLRLNSLKPVIDARKTQIIYHILRAKLTEIKIKPNGVWDYHLRKYSLDESDFNAEKTP